MCGCVCVSVRMNLIVVLRLMFSFFSQQNGGRHFAARSKENKPGRDLHLKHITPIRIHESAFFSFYLRTLGVCLMLFLMGFHVCVVRPLC